MSRTEFIFPFFPFPTPVQAVVFPVLVVTPPSARPLTPETCLLPWTPPPTCLFLSSPSLTRHFQLLKFSQSHLLLCVPALTAAGSFHASHLFCSKKSAFSHRPPLYPFVCHPTPLLIPSPRAQNSEYTNTVFSISRAVKSSTLTRPSF